MRSQQVRSSRAVVQPDLRPEQLQYQDNGCRRHPACLSCPLAICVEDLRQQPGPAAVKRRRRRVSTLAERGYTLSQIAESLGVSSSTVRRDLQMRPPGEPPVRSGGD